MTSQQRVTASVRLDQGGFEASSQSPRLTRERLSLHLRSVADRLARIAPDDLGALRATIETLPTDVTMAPGTRIVRSGSEPVPGSWFVPDNALPGRRALYCHGISLIAGSVHAYQGWVSRLAAALRTELFFVDYRLAPEHRYPAAHEDCAAALRWIRTNGAFTRAAATSLYIAGDSVGSSLALSTASSSDPHEQPVDTVLLFTPFLDWAVTGSTAAALDGRDPLVNIAAARQVAALYAPGMDAQDPRLSVLFGPLPVASRIFVFGSNSDLFVDDATRLVSRAAEAHLACELHLWSDLPHLWPFFHRELVEVGATLALIGGNARG